MPASTNFSFERTIDHSRCRAKLIWANERVVEAFFRDHRTRARLHTVCWFLDRGTVRVDEEDQSYVAKRGDWLFLAANESTQHFSPQARIISLRFDLCWLDGTELFRRQRTRILRHKDYPELEHSARELIRRLDPWRATHSLLVGRNQIPISENFAIDAAFNQWLSSYTFSMIREGAQILYTEQYDDRVLTALRAIEDHPMTESFSVSQLAAHCALSVNQLGRLLKNETGMSPFDCFERRRLNLARHALEDTEMPIKEIGYNLGFKSPSHFSNWFIRHERKSPRSYRNRTS